MDYEKKYKNALEWARQVMHGETGFIRKEVEDIFPELKENKSERVRKGLIKTISSLLDNTILYHTNITKEEALAWLEKQKLTDEEIIFRPIAGTDIRIAAKQALEKIDIGKKVVLAFNGAYIPVNGKTVGEIDSEYDAWLEKQGNKIVDCQQNHQDVKYPNGGIVMEDFNGGEGFYKLHLDYLSKKQVEEVEEMVRTWNKESKTSNENIKNCVEMCLTDANEQRFEDFGTTLKDCLAWLKKQGENKKLDADKVTAWLVANICDFEYYVKLFKKDFEL